MEFVCYQSAKIDTDKSYVRDGEAKIFVALSKSLDPAAFSLGVRQSKGGILAPPSEVERYAIDGSKFDWSEQDTHLLGQFSFHVGKSDVLQCFANFNGINYENYWLSDPDTTANPRRVALSAFDNNLDLTSDFLFADLEGKTRSNEFEVGLAWLFWMLGFSPVHIDVQNMKKLHDAPDMIFCDSRSNFLVVEATVGSLQNNHKLDKLWEKFTRLKESFRERSLSHLDIIPLIVTKRTEKYVAQELEAARRLGISVVTSEELRSLLHRSTFFPDPNSIFDRLKSLPDASVVV